MKLPGRTDVVVWEGAEALRPALVEIGSLTPYPGNPRVGDVDQIASSLARFGQVRAVLLDTEGVIVAGNHTWKAAQSLGWTHIAAIPNPFSSAAEARDYLLADNRLSDVGENDRAELRAYLEEIDAADSWAGTGYAPDDLEQMRKLDALAAVPPPPPPTNGDAAGAELHEVVLMFSDEDRFALFGGYLKVLRAEYGLEGVTETVARAVHDAALRLNQDV